MNKHDIALFAAMQTLDLKRYFSKQVKTFRHDNQYSKYIYSELKALKKRQALSAKTLRYFNDVLAPNSPGFYKRWQDRYFRYKEIYRSVFALRELRDYERLALALKFIAKHNFAVHMGHGDELDFSNEQSHKVIETGFVGLVASEQEKLQVSGCVEGTQLTYYIGNNFEQNAFALMKHLQTFGFTLVYTEQSPELYYRLFHVIEISSFADLIYRSEGVEYAAA